VLFSEIEVAQLCFPLELAVAAETGRAHLHARVVAQVEGVDLGATVVEGVQQLVRQHGLELLERCQTIAAHQRLNRRIAAKQREHSTPKPA